MTAWLRCRLDRGMFSDEVAVTYPASLDVECQQSVFVPRSYVRAETEHEGEVMVKLVAVNGGHYAVLPNCERDIVWPDAADLVRR